MLGPRRSRAAIPDAAGRSGGFGTAGQHLRGIGLRWAPRHVPGTTPRGATPLGARRRIEERPDCRGMGRPVGPPNLARDRGAPRVPGARRASGGMGGARSPPTTRSSRAAPRKVRGRVPACARLTASSKSRPRARASSAINSRSCSSVSGCSHSMLSFSAAGSSPMSKPRYSYTASPQLSHRHRHTVTHRFLRARDGVTVSVPVSGGDGSGPSRKMPRTMNTTEAKHRRAPVWAARTARGRSQPTEAKRG